MSVAKKVKLNFSDSEIDAKVLEYMKTQNRPYSCINIFDNLHGQIGKTAIQQSLDRLAASPASGGSSDGPLLILKEYGAQKFYFCNQSMFGDCSTEAVKSLDEEIRTLKLSQQTMSAEIQRILSDCPVSDKEIQDKYQALKQELEELKAQHDQQLKSQVGMEVKIKELKECQKLYGSALSESVKRKRICMSMVDELCIAMNLSKQELADELAIDLI